MLGPRVVVIIGFLVSGILENASHSIVIISSLHNVGELKSFHATVPGSHRKHNHNGGANTKLLLINL